MLAESLQHSLSEMAGDDFVKGMRMKGFELRRFSAGEIAPELLEARAYDLGPTAMAFDFDVRWHSQMVAEVDAITTGVGARVPVSVRNLRFDGPVRLIVTDLTAEAPGYGAVLLSLPTRPEVGTSNPNPNPNPNPKPNPNPNPNQALDQLGAPDDLMVDGSGECSSEGEGRSVDALAHQGHLAGR